MAINSVPMVKLDLTKPPGQLIIDLINNDNGTELKADELSFGIPELATGRHNSKVKATATENSIYSGSVTLHYNRIDIGLIPQDRSTVFEISDEVNLSDIIPEVDARYQLKLTPVDYIDAPLPRFLGNVPHEEKVVDLVAGPASLVFINKLKLTIERPAIDLRDIIKTLILNGLTYIAPPTQYLSL